MPRADGVLAAVVMVVVMTVMTVLCLSRGCGTGDEENGNCGKQNVA